MDLASASFESPFSVASATLISFIANIEDLTFRALQGFDESFSEISSYARQARETLDTFNWRTHKTIEA